MSTAIDNKLRPLGALRATGLLAPLDIELARLVLELDETGGPALAVATAVASSALGQGHSCLALEDLPAMLAAEGGPDMCPPLGELRQALDASRLVGKPGDEAPTPLVLDAAGRLYLRRYLRYEQHVAAALLARLVPHDNPPAASTLRRVLARYLPLDDEAVHGQAVAVLAGVRSRLTVITGGPGTGKTHTVAALLAVLLDLAASQDSTLRIRLAAPTGKAATRMSEALRQSAVLAQCSGAVRAALPEDAATLHRLLGARPGSTRFRHHAGNPLPVDVLVVDEASMIDLPLMARMLDALPAEATLILLGDRNQLASVEAGNVLSSIATAAGDGKFSAAFAEHARAVLDVDLPQGKAVPLLADHVIALRHNWRFGEAEGLVTLASQVLSAKSEADADAVIATLEQGGFTGVSWQPDGEPEAAIDASLQHARGIIREADDASQALEMSRRFGLLTALRRGRHGAEGINEAIDRRLRKEAATAEAFYKGRLLMVLQNDYESGLFNGDVGIVWPGSQGDGRLVACFPQREGIREVPLSLLPAHTSAWAMTIHKAQGSEFDRVRIVLPPQPARVIGRELLYTAITRARSRVDLVASEPILRHAIGHSTRRYSGLADKLAGAPAV